MVHIKKRGAWNFHQSKGTDFKKSGDINRVTLIWKVRPQ